MNEIDKYKEIEKDFEIKFGEIKSGDVIVLKYESILPVKYIERMRIRLKEILNRYNIDCPIIILDSDAQLEVLRKVE